ncbi:hypothetical protein glysoja_038009 [Glycine soja]|uniref:Uncharacterized protein n=1 Tax=Glycine soja TaxID=3848 RepID=A0A0B2P9T1_GLYSO|nr:hypothetical protein glysoja_038009 [Glycine soja]
MRGATFSNGSVWTTSLAPPQCKSFGMIPSLPTPPSIISYPLGFLRRRDCPYKPICDSIAEGVNSDSDDTEGQL